MNNITQKNFRVNYPICLDQYYFDAAGVSPLSTQVKNAINKQLDSRLNFGKKGVKSNVESIINCAKSYSAKMLETKTKNIALTTNTTQGLNIIAQGLQWSKGDEVIIPENEFPANQYPWLSLLDRGVLVKKIPTINGQFSIDDIQSVMTKRTKLLSLSHVGYLSGFCSDLKSIGKLCYDHKIIFVVDAAQSMGVIPIDVNECRISALSTSAWKWLLGPIGQGLLFCEEQLAEQLKPCFVGAGCTDLGESSVPVWPAPLKEGAAKFEFSSLDIAGVCGFAESLKLLNEIGVPCVHQHIKKLTQQLIEGLKSIDKMFSLPFLCEDNNSGIVSVKSHKKNVKQLYKELLDEGIHCACWHGCLRFSPGIYNNTEDINYLLNRLSLRKYNYVK